MGKKPESRKHGMRTPGPETEEKYREAIELYRTTGLSVREICARTGDRSRPSALFSIPATAS